jgi:putative ABC transport system permease protein
MDVFAGVLRRSLRRARARPGASVVIVLILGLAIGASTAIFSVLSAVVLRPLPGAHARRLVWIAAVRPDGTDGLFSLPELLDYREQVRSLDRLVAYASWNANLTGRGHAERLQGLRLSADAFEAMGVPPARGRLLVPADDLAGAPRVVVLGHGLWQRRFGGSEGIMGQALRLNGEAYQVVGVLPATFLLPQGEIDVVVPLAAQQDPSRAVRGSASFLRFVGRLAPGTEAEAADRELDGIAGQLRDRFPVEYARKRGVRLGPLQDELVGDSRQILFLTFAAVLLVLCVACANVVNLLLARVVERRREIAVRVALGAGWRDVLRELLVEGTVYALAGGVLGALVAASGVRALVRAAPAGIARLPEAAVDGGMLAFALVLTLGVALVAGMAPARQAFRLGGAENLLATRGPLGSTGQQQLRRHLVVAQIAVAMVLLMGSALVTSSLARLQRVDPGFSTREVFVARVSLPRATYRRPADLMLFYDRFLDRVARLPGVQAAGTVSIAPLSGSAATTQFTIEGRPPLAPGEAPDVQFRLVSPGYFEAVGIPLLRGRSLLEADRENAPPVALVNESLARRFLGPEPVGLRLLLADNSKGPRPVEVVGVVGNVKQRALDAAPTNDVYLPWGQAHPEHVAFLTNYQFWALRTAGNPLALSEPFRRELAAVDPEAAASQPRTLQQYVDATLEARRFSVLLMGAFALTALVLAIVGLYAVMAYAVSQQTREIGVRIAVGARGRDIQRLVLGQAMDLAGRGVALGAALSLLGRKAMESLLFATSASDPRFLVGVAAAVVAVALAASYLPAARASRVDPIVTLRGE